MQGLRGQTSGPAASRELAQGVRGPGEELRMPCRLALCDPGAQTQAREAELTRLANTLDSLWLHLLPMKLQKLKLSCVPPPTWPPAAGPDCQTAAGGGALKAGLPGSSSRWLSPSGLGQAPFVTLGFLACEMGPRSPPGGRP